ncbi:glycosyl hydrolase family 18 protein, partial [Thermococcus sp.]|uniref:glycosyl hydrolase family 18 protein n=1 Tax=Thermococcus sp. TaxID=35749 RepID=UPI002604702D
MRQRYSVVFLIVLMAVSLLPPLHYPWASAATQVSLDGHTLAWDVVNLTWTPVDGAKAYEIYRSTDQASLFDSSNLLVVVNWSSYPQYEAGKTYTQGDTVEYNGKIWRAKYWTQSAPGGDAWELVGDAVPSTSYLDQWNLTANTTYYYAVVPVLSDGSTGGVSNTLIVTTPYEPYRIVAYYISWARYARKFYVSDIPWEKVTHVNYAFLNLKEDGTVTYFDSYADPLNLEGIKEYKARYPEVKVLVSVGGWTLSKYFSPVAADPAKRQRFAESVLEIIRKYDLDGVDIDWEYPGGGGLESNYVSPDDGKNFIILLKTIREAFDRAERRDHKDYLITAAVPADPVKAARINWTEASKYLDSINVMTYDYHGAWDEITGHNAPLYCDPNAPYEDENVRLHFCVNYSIQWYIQHVPDRTKITLGLPFYSRSFANVPPEDDGLYQPFSGTPDGTWGPASETYGVMDYWDVAEKNQSADYDYHWDPIAQVAWLYSPGKRIFITFDDPKAIGIKVDYALLNGIGGVMIWEITADRKPGTNSHPLLDTVLDRLGEKPPAWIPDTYYIGSSVPANLTVPEPGYDNSTQTGGSSGNTGGNQTGGGTGDNQTGGNTGGNQTSGSGNEAGSIGDNQTSSDLVRPDAFSVKVTDWGNTEYDVTLDLGQKVDWVVKVKLREGSSVSSSWSVTKAEEGEYIVFTPASWNKGPTASFGFIATGSKPVEAMYLYVDNQLWDVWPENVTVNETAGGTGDNSTNTGNQTDTGTGDSGGSNN